jgi:hypothetical protein
MRRNSQSRREGHADESTMKPSRVAKVRSAVAQLRPNVAMTSPAASWRQALFVSYFLVTLYDTRDARWHPRASARAGDRGRARA